MEENARRECILIHILLLILKIIGIIILSVLGLVLLVCALILFVPVRYRAAGDYHKRLTGKIHIGWLFNLIRFNASYDEEFNATAKVLWFRLYDSNAAADDDVKDRNTDKNTSSDYYDTHKKNKSARDNDNNNSDRRKNVFDDMSVEDSSVADNNDINLLSDIKATSSQTNESPVATDEKTEYDKSSDGVKNENTSADAENENISADDKKTACKHTDSKEKSNADKNIVRKKEEKETKKKKVSLPEKIKLVILNITNKVKKIINVIGEKLKSLINTRDKLKKKIDDIKAIINDDANREMVSLLKEQLKQLFKEIRPVKHNINIHFGCDDPADTGHILMYASILYGLSGIEMNITPDFDNKIIEGDIYIKGRIRIYKLLIIAFRVYKNERFRELVLKR